MGSQEKTGRGLDTDVQFLKGVGPKHAAALNKLGAHTVRDVLFMVPRRYEDRREIPPISFLRPGQHASVRGRIVDIFTKPVRGGRVLLRASLQDDTGRIALVWFNQPWVAKQLQKVKGEVIAYGQIKEGDRRTMEMLSPEWEELDEGEESDEFARLVPVYGLSEGVPQWLVRKAAKSAVELFATMVVDPLPEAVRKAEKVAPLSWALRQMHMPEDTKHRDKARERLVFEEFLYLQLMLQLRKMRVHEEVGIPFPISPAVRTESVRCSRSN